MSDIITTPTPSLTISYSRNISPFIISAKRWWESKSVIESIALLMYYDIQHDTHHSINELTDYDIVSVWQSYDSPV